MNSFYDDIFLVVPVVSHLEKRIRADYSYTLMCGRGDFILRSRGREQSKVMIKEYQGNLTRGRVP